MIKKVLGDKLQLNSKHHVAAQLFGGAKTPLMED